MTQPVYQPGQVLAAQNTSATPQGVADRVQLLNSNGHDWMDPQTQTTLATSQTSDSELLSIADNIKSTLANTWHGFTEAVDDPVLHKQPTATLALARYLNASIGPLPVAEGDLNKIQANLQKAGYGKDLQANGNWGSDWNAAYNEWAGTLKARQLAGDKPGSVSTAKAAGHWYDVFNPVHDVNAIVGYAKAIPGDVRNIVSDAVGAIVGPAEALFTDPLHPGRKVASTTAAASTALGAPLTAQQVEDQSVSRAVQDITTVLTLAPLIRTGTAAALAAHGAWEAGVDAAAAQRTTGVIAKSLFGGLTRSDLGVPTGADVLTPAGRSIMDTGARNELRRGVLNSRVFQNIPLLRQVGPVVGRLADADGLYYKARTLLAAPYTYGPVRALGQAGQSAFLSGAALRGTAQAEQALGAGNQQTHDILHTDALSTIDMNINRIAHTPFAHPLSDAVDALGYVLHGPLGSTAASDKIGDVVQGGNDAFSHFLGTVDVRGTWERAVSKATGTKTSIEDLEKQFGGPENLDRFMAMKLADLAAANHAQETAQNAVENEGLVFGSQEYRDRTGQAADEVWNNPALHHQAIVKYIADPTVLENRIAADAVHTANSPKTYAANSLKWMEAGGIHTDIIRSGLAQHLFGPDGKAIIANAQDRFDYGDGAADPVRVMDTTRRDYVNQVSKLHQRVVGHVTTARTQAGKDVAAAEKAVQDAQANLTSLPQGADRAEARSAVRSASSVLTQARRRQQQLEAHLEDSAPRKFAEVAKKLGSPVKSKFQWEHFIRDSNQLRGLVDQGTTDRLTLQHLVDNGVNPDELYTNINGAPRLPTEDVGSGDWMRQHLAHSDGTLGLGHVDTKSAQEASADLTRLRTAYDNAATQEAKDAVIERVKNYGFTQFGITEKTLGLFSPDQLFDRLSDQAGRLASEVFLTHDAPQELKDKIDQIKALGYRPMLGSHIGHMWDASLPPMPELGAAISRRRKIASVIGVAPEQISPRAAGMDARIRVLRQVGKVTEQGGVFPARHTADSVLSVLTDKNLLKPDMKLPERLAFETSKWVGLHKGGIAQLARERGITDMQQAKLAYESELARGLQVRDIPRKEFLKALTTPGTFENGTEWAGVDQKTANLIHRAVLSGYADRPGYIMGLSALEDWWRGGFGLMNKAAVKYADSEFIQRAAALPNQVVIARNRLRFTLSPFFDWRRVSKQNYKMGLDGVAPTLNPLAHMVGNDTFDKAHALLSKIVGDPQVSGFDDADRYLHQQSVWGMYNSRHFEAYYAWEKKLQGASEDEIRTGIHRVFDYGSARAGGRSALERSVNTVWFPFSFEKNLLRNTGAYMLNHPQQALLATGIMTAYNEANQNEQIHQWIQDHLPVVRDLQKLNAFAHGISPGEPGGINAPLLNMFLPQQWGQQLTKKNLARNFPIYNDFSNLYSDVRAQAVIGKNGLLNAADYAISMGKPRGQFDPYRPTITSQAQIRQAGAMRSQFITNLAPILDYNAKQGSDATKATFPDDPRLPTSVRGKVVNRSTIGALVKIWYPAYNPSDAKTYAIQQADKAQKYVDGITDPSRRQDYGVFLKLANAAQGHLQRGDYDTPEAAQVISQFRNAAIAASESDPSFYKFYNSHFRFLFGPIEEIRG